MKSLVYVASLAVLVCTALAANISIKTTGGAISCPVDDKQRIYTCKGVPYGESTAGSSRFMPPAPRRPWSDVFVADKWGNGCISLRSGVDTSPNPSEDCLNLNVFAPVNMIAPEPYPIMVWIYGGGFQEGMAEGPLEIYDASYYASQHNVVVVTLNYRLGVYGFLVTDGTQGNMGILDQRLALQWVRDNAAAFHGDAKRVTIFGESAGAMSVGIHIMSPGSRGLFQQAILQSNPVGLRYMTTDRATLFGREFCRQAGCADATGKCDLQCIQSAPLDVVAKASKAATGNATIYIEANYDHLLDGILGFKPTIDGKDIPMQILEYLDSPRFAKENPNLHLIVGSTSDEAIPFVAPSKTPEKPLPMSLYEIVAPILLGSQRGKAVVDYYKPRYKDALLAFIQTMTDVLFRCSALHFAAATSQASGIGFAYRYDHVFSQSQLWRSFGFPELCEVSVCHCAELPFVFHKTSATSINPPVDIKMTPEEVKFSRQIAQYWANFAYTGDPNAPGAGNVVEQVPIWTRYNNSTRVNQLLRADGITTENSADLCGMWDSVGYDILVSKIQDIRTMFSLVG